MNSLFGEMGETVNSVNILGMWSCSQEKRLLFQAYSKLVFQFLVKIRNQALGNLGRVVVDSVSPLPRGDLF